MKPFFSVIIPVYNAEKYIAKCLDSCIGQTFGNIEIIIVDDCGQDKSTQIVQEYIHKYSNIHLVSNPKNMGTFFSRIEGIKKTNGLFSLFVDADDELAPDTCSTIYECIQSNLLNNQQYPDIVNFGLKFLPQSITKIQPKVITKQLSNNGILQEFFLKQSTPPWSLCTKAFKTSILRKTIEEVNKLISPHTQRLIMAEDALFFFIIAMQAKKSIGINKDLYLYTQNPSSITQCNDSQTIEEKKQNLLYIINVLHQIPATNSQEMCKERFVNILKSVIELEYRYQNTPFSYPKACIKSLKYHQKWQTYLRILLFTISFGKIKL